MDQASASPAPPAPQLSLVIPAYNEAQVIPALLARVEAAMRATGRRLNARAALRRDRRS